MRLLFLSQEIPPETAWGGIGTYAGIVTPALARRGVEVHALSVVPGQRRSEALRDGVHVHRVPLRRPRGVGRALRLPETWSRVSLAVAVAREASRLGLRFDVCESPEWNAEGLAIALRGSLPLIVRLHSGASQVFPHLGTIGPDRRLAMRAERALIRRADVITGPAAIVKEVQADLDLPESSLMPINYPVAAAAPAAQPAGPARIVFAGRLEPRKGPDVLIRAAPRILEQHPQARFALVGADAGGAGGGSFKAELEGLATRLGVAAAIEMPGRADGPAAVAAELSRSTLCAMPSRWESMGYVAAEAAALGRPVVGSAIPALEEIVRDGESGRLVPPGDPDALADGILEVLALTPERRREMGQAGARLVATRCDPDRVADQTLAAYELAISRASGRGAARRGGRGSRRSRAGR